MIGRRARDPLLEHRGDVDVERADGQTEEGVVAAHGSHGVVPEQHRVDTWRHAVTPELDAGEVGRVGVPRHEHLVQQKPASTSEHIHLKCCRLDKSKRWNQALSVSNNIIEADKRLTKWRLDNQGVVP